MADIPKLATCDKKLRTCTGWTILFMVLLRIAIGWHFFYEGAWKLMEDDWRATNYLVASMGPCREFFRSLVDDVDGLEQLTVQGMQAKLDERGQALLEHYDITDKDMVDKVNAFIEKHKASAEKDPDYAGVVAGASSRLADAVYAGFLARPGPEDSGLPAPPAFAENDVKAGIDAALAVSVEAFVPRKIERGPASAEVAEAVKGFLGDRGNQQRLTLLKAAFANDVRNFKLGYVESLFTDAEFNQQIEDYKTLLAEVAEYEYKLGTTGYNKERLLDQYGRKARTKTAVLARTERLIGDSNPTIGLDSFVLAQLNKAYADAKATGDAKADTEWQPRLAKSLPKQPSPTRWIDWSNMIALAAVGAGLMLGLFTRLSALGGIGLLMMYYWAMPSLPWLPEAGPTEGHYLFINKNVIEALALAMIATSRVGRWGGLDGLLFRRRRIEAASR